LCLCFSPAGDQLRTRCRNFPGLVSNTTIDWFFEWPEEALLDVANFKLSEYNLEDEIKPHIIRFFAQIHTSINDYSKDFMKKLRRLNFTTPKHFLNLISQ